MQTVHAIFRNYVIGLMGCGMGGALMEFVVSLTLLILNGTTPTYVTANENSFSLNRGKIGRLINYNKILKQKLLYCYGFEGINLPRTDT